MHAESKPASMDVSLRPVTGAGTWRPITQRRPAGGAAARHTLGMGWAAWAAGRAWRYAPGDPAWDALPWSLLIPRPGSGGAPARPLYVTLRLAIPAAQRAIAGAPGIAPTGVAALPQAS